MMESLTFKENCNESNQNSSFLIEGMGFHTRLQDGTMLKGIGVFTLKLTPHASGINVSLNMRMLVQCVCITYGADTLPLGLGNQPMYSGVSLTGNPVLLCRFVHRHNNSQLRITFISLSYGGSYMPKQAHVRIIIFLLLITFLLAFSVQAQDGITISISVAAFNENTYEDALEEFEAQHPGVRVHIEASEFGVPFFYFDEVEQYLNDVAEYAETADVLLVNGELAPEATRAGYFLDLTPLVSTDTALNTADFYPPLWDSFQWDGGVWAIPIAGEVIGLYYNPQAFDDAGLAYPNENWSIADFENAIQTLAQFNDEGEIVTPGLLNMGGMNNFGMLLISMLGDDVVDDGILPNVPDFSNPDIASLVTAWADIRNTGAMDFPDSGFNSNTLPFTLGPSFLGISFGEDNANIPVPFPGGGIGIDPQGFAISAGTQNPELAYELIKFLTTSPEIAETFFSETPARRSMNTSQTDEDVTFTQMTPELEAFIAQGMETGISLSEARFSRYLSEVIFQFTDEQIDVQQALNELEDTWMERLAIADERGTTTDFTVLPPAPPPVLAEGEISLNFKLAVFFSPLPNESEWQTFIDEFVASEPEIGFVDLEVGFVSNTIDLVEESDCFYVPFNLVPSMDTTTVISLDPLMSADPNLDINDFLPNVLPMVQHNGLTWAFPLTLQPTVLNYNTGIFQEAGIPFPENGWTVDDFEIALRNLEGYVGENEQPFVSQSFDNTYLLSLIAAYGGLPVDTRTTPYTYNFTDPVNVEAIRQVLDLVVEGYISYSELANFTGGGGGFSSSDTPIYSESLDGSRFAFAPPEEENPYRFTTFPTGAQYSAVTFSVGAAYISANTQYIDPCYRLISQMANRPDLFYAMPARRSLINAPGLATTQSQAAVDFYNTMSEVMSNPNTIVLAGASTSGGFIESLWLNRVFDGYVAGEITDLEVALAEAQQYTLAFVECSANIPPFQDGVDDPQAYFEQFIDCAISIDPTASEYFSFFQ